MITFAPLQFRSLAASLIAFSMVAGTAAFAEPITYTADPATAGKGTIVAQIPVSSIGPLATPSGMAVFSGHSVEIDAVPEWLFDRDAVLSGALINSTMTQSGPNAIIKGLVYFNDGAWLKNLGSTVAHDTIRTTGGVEIIGNVQAVLPDGLEILQLAGGRRKVTFAEIEDMESPRAFKFAATAESLKLDPPSPAITAQSLQIVFAGTGLNGRLAMRKPTLPQSHLPGTEGGVPNSVIASEVLIDVAMNVIAPAVAIPIVFGVTNNASARARLRFAARTGGEFGIVNP